ncbi:DUF7513 family protein [Haloarcula argentinensis]|uniref:DUF7513 domain-containing protein n=1 Tax=Haloarcula argentinensis TaxID=43776 RepID=A0ABU2EX31_HALAR|nr:hypothetical protein [Haloarcula argentinensis]EMA23582.1 hypothetical protein C443_07958 [Haloarcula argentinensis DSM 12282]MDS0252811.1 hypothetical protein [Haloarcula argentinensis]
MSMFSKFLTGMSFRSTTPTFEAGEEIEVYVTELDEESGELVAQVGETRLHFENGEADIVGCRVLATVESFDNAEHRGRVSHRKTLSQGSF